MSRKFSTVQYTGHELSTSKGGHPQLMLNLRIVEGDRAGENLTAWYVLAHEKSTEFATKALRALGMINNDITAPKGLGGTRAQAVESQETYNGETRWRVQYINPVKAKAELDTATTDQFRDMFTQALSTEDTIRVSDDNKALDLPEALPEGRAQTEEY